MLDALRLRLARLIAPRGVATRQYAAARNSRLHTWGSAGNSSADSELSMSLTAMRARSRKLMRDAPYAKRARTIVVNNVVGSGVGMQCQVYNTRGELHERINADIEMAWREWSKASHCHTGGRLHFSDLERMLMAQVFDAGEVLVRIHRDKFGGSKVPIALELIEAERLADEFSNPHPSPTNSKAEVRLGVEVDTFGRPVAYWIRERHPGEIRTTADATVRLERVPASDILHLGLLDRWPQTRGEPWLHSVIAKLDNMDEYSASELTAARMGANFFATLETDGDNGLSTTTDTATGAREMNIEPGVIEQLAPGDKLNFHTPNRPNVALDPFLRYMLREVAAGVGCSYESLSRDYSQSNYSSSRLALLDDRDLWRVLQQWWARSFRQPLYEQWLQAAVLARAVEAIPVESYALRPEVFTAVTWKFRGWSWVDPTKEVNAYKEAVKAGFTTISAVIAQTGGGVDIEDVIAERKRELDMFDEAEIDVDTKVEEPQPEPVAVAAPAPKQEPDKQDDEESRSRLRSMISSAIVRAQMDGEQRGRADAQAEAMMAVAQALERKETVINVAAPDIPPTVVNVAPAEAPVVNIAPAEVNVAAPVVNVAPADVRVEAPVVNVATPEIVIPAPIVNVAAPEVRVEAPTIHVDPTPPVVNVITPAPRQTRTVVERRDENGAIVSARTEEIEP